MTLLRDPATVRRLAANIASLLPERAERPVAVMEVCGTHTMSIGRWGLRQLLPKGVRLVSGPGCPVCVTPASFFDALWETRDATIAVFGDLMRVPGSQGTLEQLRAQGRDVRVVHSPLQALKLAREQPTVFAAVGFETTAPGVAETIMRAHDDGVKDFHVLCGCKRIEPAMRALIERGAELDGFLLPGHVAAVTGARVFGFLPHDYGLSGVVAGFEPVDILAALTLLARLIVADEPAVRNAYPRVVRDDGASRALALIDEVFQPVNAEWRGLGVIPASGLALRGKYAHLDAAAHYDLTLTPVPDPPGCRCADVLRGRITPSDCPLFGKRCKPGDPVGPCMVSSEGACAAWHRYER